MTAVVLNEVRKGFYLDSVALMRLSREIATIPGVVEAALMMGTPSNIAIMRNAGLLSGDISTQGSDLILAVKAETEQAARAALDDAAKALDKPKSQAGGKSAWRPRSIASAVAATPNANIALISVPGEFAAAEARKALNRGLHVLMFSDNVSIADELSLKQQAREAGLLMMGPDCGTAIINGAPLAFANKLKRGKVGIIGASGTGTQEISCLVSEAGVGISHAIGVGGRDLKKDIGGITTLMAIDALDADPAAASGCGEGGCRAHRQKSEDLYRLLHWCRLGRASEECRLRRDLEAGGGTRAGWKEDRRRFRSGGCRRAPAAPKGRGAYRGIVRRRDAVCRSAGGVDRWGTEGCVQRADSGRRVARQQGQRWLRPDDRPWC